MQAEAQQMPFEKTPERQKSNSLIITGSGNSRQMSSAKKGSPWGKFLS